MRRPSAFDVRRIEMGSNHARLEQDIAAAEADFAVRAAHHAARWPRRATASAITHMSFVSVRSAPSSVRIFSPGLRAAHDDALFAELIEIECVQRLAQLEHHVVRDVHHVVDGVLADGFEALPQPVGRRLNFHAAQNARRVSPAKIRRFDFHARRRRELFPRIPSASDAAA